MSSDVIAIARRAHQAWAEERHRLFPGRPLEVFDELPDELTAPWIEVGAWMLEMPEREDEPLVHELEVPLRPRTSESGVVLKPAPPTRLTLRRSLARDELAVLGVEGWRADLQRLQLCTGVDITWIERLATPDVELLDGLMWSGWPTLQAELHDVWAEAEETRLRIEFARAADAAALDELARLEAEFDEGPRPGVSAAIEARRRVLAEPLDETTPLRTLADLPTLPRWVDVVATSDHAAKAMWREAAFAAAKDADTLHLCTPGVDPLVWRREVEAGDLVQLRRFPTREEGCLEIAARVCKVDRARLLELHFDDYERVEMWVFERLGKSSTESADSSGPSLSQRLRRYSGRRKPKRPTSSR